MFIRPTCCTELYKTTKTTVKHQQYNQAMLSGSITSMRFYFIVPYAVKKKNIYVSSNQTYRAVLIFLDDILFELCVQIFANEILNFTTSNFLYSFAFQHRPNEKKHLTLIFFNINQKHKSTATKLN